MRTMRTKVMMRDILPEGKTSFSLMIFSSKLWSSRVGRVYLPPAS
jgi:hypothetical protein